MKYIFTLLFLLFIKFSYTQAPNWQWAIMGASLDHEDLSAVTTDPSGNVYITGYFAGDSIVFGNQSLYNNTPGFDDLFIAKYDASGNLIWAHAYGEGSDDKGTSLASDANGNIYLAGLFYSSTITFGSHTLTNTGTCDIFIVKYDQAGNILDAWNEGGFAVDIPHSITVDNSDNLIVTGRFSSLSITFGSTTIMQAGSMDVFTVKYDASGNVLWAKGAGSGSNDEGHSVKTDPAGNIYIAGYFNQTASFGNLSVTSAGSSDIFIAKYDPSGNIIWVKRAGDDLEDVCKSIYVDADGHCYAGGNFRSATIQFGSTILNAAPTGSNSFIAGFDSSGNSVWALSAAGDCRLNGVTGYNSTIYACGNFLDDTLTFGPYSLIANDDDMFLLACNNTGIPLWVTKQTSDGDDNESATAITADASGNIYTGGFFDSDPVVFGPSTLNALNNGFDIFLARLGTGTSLPSFLVDNSYVYPNPGPGLFQISVNSPLSELLIFDLQGKLLKTVSHPRNSVLDLRDYATGVYILHCITSGGTYVTRIVKQ